MDELKPAGITDLERLAQITRAPDPAVVALVRAGRLLHDNIVEGAFIKEENIILMQDALAPFKHIEEE